MISKFELYWLPYILIICTIAIFILTIPIKPWLPNSSDLKSISGMPRFEYDKQRMRVSRISFFIDNVILHCDFSAFEGGVSGCERDEYKRKIKNVPCEATYFIMRSRLGEKCKMLNTLKQNGIEIISSADAYRCRLNSYKADIVRHYVDTLFFAVFTVLSFVIKMVNCKNMVDSTSKRTT